ncbi:hypothetical protein KC909_01755 [Candidatus Dojkabacteria bacterium]|uniref:SH3 domain-containing protein n=1 Tax=Candidatus Dojkabacteria bacterium TaxID=2099670 RepID=A0A955RIN3_9BACT|nr:hypothetical protein [Candidatus Dojkabacteria bacterium]
MNKTIQGFLALLISLFLLAACNSEPNPTPMVVVETRVVTQIEEVTREVVVIQEVVVTPPPTETPVPMPTDVAPTAAPPSGPVILQPNASTINMRIAPSTDAFIARKLNADQQATAIYQKDGWLVVEIDEVYYWVAGPGMVSLLTPYGGDLNALPIYQEQELNFAQATSAQLKYQELDALIADHNRVSAFGDLIHSFAFYSVGENESLSYSIEYDYPTQIRDFDADSMFRITQLYGEERSTRSLFFFSWDETTNVDFLVKESYGSDTTHVFGYYTNNQIYVTRAWAFCENGYYRSVEYEEPALVAFQSDVQESFNQWMRTICSSE